MCDFGCNKALKYWEISFMYIQLAQRVAENTLSTGNPIGVISDIEISDEEFLSKTQWSDFNVILPLLFNFYHGIELLLKGFLIVKKKEVKKTHRLSELLTEFNKHFPNHSIYSAMSRYIFQDQLIEPLRTFCSGSITMDEFYQSLKYPENKKGILYQHRPLIYQNKRGLRFFKQLVRDIRRIQHAAPELAKTLCPSLWE